MGENIKWLSNLSKKDISLAGGKGANLGEMYQNKFPVPQAFVVTTDAFYLFLKKSKLEQKIKDIVNKIDVDNTSQLTEKAQEIRDLITSAKMPQELEKEVLEAYDHFNIDLNEIKGSPGALAILKSAREPIFVSVRSSATAEDLGDASFAGQQSSFLNVKGNQELLKKVKECFASIFTARSIYYRKKKGFDGLVGIAAIVQKMINADKSGVMFSKNPVKNNEEILIEAVFGLGEGIVSGKIKPDQHTLSPELEILTEAIADKKLAMIRTADGTTKTVELEEEKSKSRVLKTYEIKQLAEYALKLEEHYNVPQDIEFSIEDNEIYILQTRPITTLKKPSGEKEAELTGQVITEGMPASPGIASGVVKIIHSMDDLNKIKKGDILVTTMTNPDMVVSMQKASAILTSEGGVTAHAAIVSREMGIPAIVGAQNALEVLKDGDEITIDGYTGKVFQGRAENKSVEILPIVPTKTKIKVLVDLPQFAKRAAKTKAYGVGLVRLEGLIASQGKHPLAYEQENKLDEYQKMLEKGLGQIAETFIGKPIWVRSSDIRSDEYSNLEGAPKEIEKNPMLGDHGIRFSLKHPEIFKAELKALKTLANKGHKFGVMFPQIISVDEVKQAKKIFEELKIDNVQFGVMIETPAASILIKDICEVGIDFISFGTNDLTQYTLAIDRGNEEVQHIYDETNWAVLKQISRVIRECKKQGVESSICGQAGSKPEMVKFLVKQGIDSISVNADAAKEISELVQKLEQGKPTTNSQEPKTSEPKVSISPIDNKEEIKEELEELKQEETLKENLNPEPREEIVDTSKEEYTEEEPKKEDIFE
ncbi:phosphoenolpyruvate synthase [Methanococcoides sp. SA1]|nr:phosphoenolpyruvate synthase [Methanococcoides sp. SA1]